jgi:threonine dehydratase
MKRRMKQGMTALLALARLGLKLGMKHLFVKDEGLLPIGSFKARACLYYTCFHTYYVYTHALEPTS